MNFIIKLVGSLLGQKIQSGSTRGAFLGAIIGLLLGATLAVLLIKRDLIASNFSVAIYFVTCIPLAMLGALVGAAIGPRKPPFDARSAVRLTRYNHAAGVLFIALIFLSLFIAIILFPDEKKSPRPSSDGMSRTESRAILIGTGVLALIALLLSFREIWYIDVASHLRVRRLLGSQFYARHDVKMWGFEIRPNEVIQRSFNGKSNFCLQFTDGQLIKIEVDGENSQAIIDALGLPTPTASKG